MQFSRHRRLMALASLALSLAVGGCGAAKPQSAPSTSGAAGQLAPPIRILVPAPNYVQPQYQSTVVIANAWKQLGLTVDLVTHPNWATFVGEVDDRSKWEAAVQGFVPNPSRLDPNEFLTRPLLCSLRGAHGSNYGEYCNPAFDKLSQQQSEAMDPSARQKVVFQAQELLAKDLPMIVVYNLDTISVYNKRKYDKVYTVPGVGLQNVINYTQANPSDGTINTSYVGAFKTINPFNAPAYDLEDDYKRLVYDTLAVIDSDGKVMPWAAESWQASADGKTVDVTLRPGMKFTDGVPVTAKDVAFSYNAMKADKVGYYVTALAAIDNVEAVDDLHVRFHMKEPFAALYGVTFPQIPIVPEHIWSKISDHAAFANTQMIGSGPYKLQRFVPNEELDLVANPDHFHAPKAKRLVLRMFASADTRFLAMQKGDIDFHESKGLTPDQVIQAKKDTADFGIIDEPGIGDYWMVYNLSRPPFNDYAFRQALSYAIDYQTITQSILHDQGQMGEGVIAVGNKFWHDPNVHFPTYDLAKAKQLLQQAGYTWDGQGQLHLPASYKPQALPQGS